MADTPDLGSGPARGEGSSPFARTTRDFLIFRDSLALKRRRPERGEMFVNVEGLQRDVQGFFSLPAPRAVWNAELGIKAIFCSAGL